MQRRHLQLYLRFRGRRMTVTGLIWASRRVYALLFLLLGALAALLYFFINPAAAACAGLALVVAILRDIGYFRRSTKVWPILEEVLDWSRVEQLAGPAEGKPE